jgi:heme/copper-type cytochrome/quinol oxidase subunit 2
MNTGCTTELAHSRVGCYEISETSVIIMIIIITIIIIIIIIIMRFSITCGLTRTYLPRYSRTDYIKLNDNELPMDVSLLNNFRLSHPPSKIPDWILKQVGFTFTVHAVSKNYQRLYVYVATEKYNWRSYILSY